MSLDRHNRLLDHAALSFRADCPSCQGLRLAGRVPDAGLMSPRAAAGVAAAAIALSGSAPAVAVASPQTGHSANRGDVPNPPGSDHGGGDNPPILAPPAPGHDNDNSGGGDEPSIEPPVQPPIEPPVKTPTPPVQTEQPAPQTAPAPPAPPAPPAKTGPPARQDVAPPGGHRDTPAAKQLRAPAGADKPTKRTSGPDAPRGGRESPKADSAPRSHGHTASQPGQSQTDSPRSGAPTANTPKNKDGTTSDRQPASGVSKAGATHVVQRGECLWAIAQRQLGAGASPAQTAAYVQKLWDRNAAAIHTGDPNLIYAGQRIELPK